MTRSPSSLGLSKNPRKSTKSSKSSKSSVTSSSSPPRCHSPKPLRSSTISLHNMDRDLNDVLRNFVDELCDIFVKARQDGKNEAQTVDIILDYFSSKNLDYTQVFDWLLNNTHKDKYKTILGYFYDQGIATNRNQRKAYCLYLSAAKKGYSIAEDLLGDCYYSGQGTTRDRDMAFEWYQKAADNGSTGSQFSLGICYAFGEEGKGTDEDLDKAIYWYQMSAKNGHEIAQRRVQSLLNLMSRKPHVEDTLSKGVDMGMCFI
ncbi:9652_t:CDS:2 [Cetraspora pellucida]|uniref:9652_t:CDS:1 n=1 Tax=Cetraspora pellucida TaxID=1433469 RepID=A0A9N9B6Z2_9GLOM|nr:9652_t:CDS:2 [Cetraspora pellucida]